jgi:hypothetical protein
MGSVSKVALISEAHQGYQVRNRIYLTLVRFAYQGYLYFYAHYEIIAILSTNIFFIFMLKIGK